MNDEIEFPRCPLCNAIDLSFDTTGEAVEFFEGQKHAVAIQLVDALSAEFHMEFHGLRRERITRVIEKLL